MARNPRRLVVVLAAAALGLTACTNGVAVCVALQALPAVHVAACSPFAPRQRAPHVGQDGCYGGESALGAVAGADTDLDTVQLRELVTQAIDHHGG